MLPTCSKPPRARPLGGKMEPVLRPQHTAGGYENGSAARKTPKHRYLWQIRTVPPPWGLCTLFRLLKTEADSPPKAPPGKALKGHTLLKRHRAHEFSAASFCPTPGQGSLCEEERAGLLPPPTTGNKSPESEQHYKEFAGHTQRSKIKVKVNGWVNFLKYL